MRGAVLYKNKKRCVSGVYSKLAVIPFAHLCSGLGGCHVSSWEGILSTDRRTGGICVVQCAV